MFSTGTYSMSGDLRFRTSNEHSISPLTPHPRPGGSQPVTELSLLRPSPAPPVQSHLEPSLSVLSAPTVNGRPVLAERPSQQIGWNISMRSETGHETPLTVRRV